MKNVIYETKGRAREFCELAINLYSGCEHRCTYCYGPDVTHQSKQNFRYNVKPRVTVAEIEQSARHYARLEEIRPILMCFITDPYQPLEMTTNLTEHAIEILHKYNLSFAILTKAGRLVARDFWMYKERDSFATTLTCTDNETSRKWEPNASLPIERIGNLSIAHQIGIKTWVSLEPVIDPRASIALVEKTAPYVDHYKVGKMNYVELDIDWASFAHRVMTVLRNLGKGFYIKKDLGKYIGYPDGFREGEQLP